MTDPNVARERPELAVLSALAHAEDPDPHIAANVGLAAIQACRNMDADVATLYYDVIRNALTHAARNLLEALMQVPQNREYKTDFARKYVAEGEAKGEVKGRVEGQALSICRVLDKRRIALSDEQRALILACTDLPTLDRWLDISVEATAASDLFL